MKLWLLKPVPDHPAWEPWYDKAFGFVVRAESAAAARTVIVEKEIWNDGPGNEGRAAWLDESASTCTELTADGPVEIILRDFSSS